MPLTNAPTNALQATTNDPANAYANAPTNATDALHTRPPIPPMLIALSRALVPRAQTRCADAPPRPSATATSADDHLDQPNNRISTTPTAPQHRRWKVVRNVQ